MSARKSEASSSCATLMAVVRGGPHSRLILLWPTSSGGIHVDVIDFQKYLGQNSGSSLAST